MASAFRFEGAFPVATAYAWPAMKVYQPCRAARRSSFLTTSLARFSAEGSSRDSSSFPDRTWRSTRSASGSSEILSSVSVVAITRSIRSAAAAGPFRGGRGRPVIPWDSRRLPEPRSGLDGVIDCRRTRRPPLRWAAWRTRTATDRPPDLPADAR